MFCESKEGFFVQNKSILFVDNGSFAQTLHMLSQQEYKRENCKTNTAVKIEHTAEVKFPEHL